MAASGEHIAEANTPQFQQYWISAAAAAGISRADIDAFIAENGPEDLPTIVSRLGPNPGPGPGTGAGSYSAAIYGGADVYAVPTPVASAAGMITTAADSDARIIGSAAGAGNSIGPQLVTSSPVLATVLPAKGIPTWAIVLAAVALIMLFRDKGGRR